MADQTRPYRMQRRAESQEQTRQRIAESAVALHGTLGPSRTSISAVAAHAGVRRSTLYRHFPDEAALFDACTAHWTAANPPPDLGDWPAIESPDERLRVALDELYAFYGRTETMLDNLFRDEEPCRSSRSDSPPSAATSMQPATPSWRAQAAWRGHASARRPPSDTRPPSPPGSRSFASNSSTPPRP